MIIVAKMIKPHVLIGRGWWRVRLGIVMNRPIPGDNVVLEKIIGQIYLAYISIMGSMGSTGLVLRKVPVVKMYVIVLIVTRLLEKYLKQMQWTYPVGVLMEGNVRI